MKFLKKIAFCYAAPLLTICSVATSQLEAQCDPSPCSIDWCSLLVPALVGAAAGAATGAAVNSRGKHGKKGDRGHRGEQGDRGHQGERGPDGDNPFTCDYNHSLTFEFEINQIIFVTPSASGSTLLPYISQPDGHILSASPIAFTNSNSVTSTTVTIATPLFGDYVFGFDFPSHDSDVTIVYTINITPTGRPTTTYTGSITLAQQTNRVQLPFNFTNGPKGTVPSSHP
ncbi:MAG: collagen-like protein [Parachlamydiaceae bacterium]|nr:collagen-like protein [Parachlamydiaceae bacterium]